MHNESQFERIAPAPSDIVDGESPKESFLRRNGHLIFWGSMIALPVMNVTAAYFGYKTSKNELAIAMIKDRADDLAELAQQTTQS